MLIDPRCDLKLFIEGYSCSIMSASISTAVKLTAAVEVLPTKQVRQIKPMTNIVIGYRDVAGKKAALTDEKGTTYSVLFVGMVIGMAITKSGTTRSASLSCSGHQVLLERHYTYVSNVATQSFSQKQNFVGASSFFREEMGKGGLSGQVAAVFKDDAPPFTPGLQELTGPPRGAIKLIEKCIGVTLPADSTKEGKVHGAQHEFFAHASHQCRLLFQIDGVSVDEGLNDIIDKDSTGAYISNAASQMSDHTDLATMLDILLKHMYYCFTPMGAPRTYVSSDKEILQRGNMLTELTQKYEVISSATGDKPPEALFDGTGIIVNFKEASVAAYSDIPAGDKQDDAALAKFIKLLKTPKGVYKVLPRITDEINNLVPSDRHHRLLERCAPFIFAGVKIYRNSLNQPTLTEQQAQEINQIIPFILRSIAGVAKVGKSRTQGNSFARVVSYNMMPDLTFCTPPTCNVIFPNQISTFNYTKNAFNMPTRLLLHGSLVAKADGRSGGVAGYYAPSTSAFVKQEAIAKEKVDIPLLPHEKFTGIVPSFASISFYERFKSARLDDLNTMLRIANFNLMLKRYESTTITCTGPFNPFVAVGFPIAFIDVDDINAETPSTYIGILSSCSHSYSGAGSASTTYTVKCVREVGEVDEVFGDAILRSTNSASPTATTLSYTGTGPNFVSDAFRKALLPADSMPVFLAAYTLRSEQEQTLNGTKKKFREVFLAGNVLTTLKPHLPTEIASSDIVAADWVGSGVVTPKIALRKINNVIAGGVSTILEYVAKEPVVNNIAQSAEQAAVSLEKYFVAAEAEALLDVERRGLEPAKQLSLMINSLRAISSTKKYNAPFSEALLYSVFQGASILQRLITEIPVVVKDALHTKDRDDALTEEIAVTWFSLLPISVDKIIKNGTAGNKMSYFGGGITFPDNATKQVSVYLSSAFKNTGTPTAAEKIAVEELYRPPWFSDIFSIGSIGQSVYQRALGCGSVQDIVPASVPKDTSVNVDGGSVLTHTTKTSLIEAYKGYRRAPAYSKGEFVNSFVRRPIANVQDVLGEFGLLTTPIADACVVDLGQICNKSKVRDLAATDATSKSLTFAPNELVSEKREGVVAYVSSTKGDAFR